MSKSVNWNFDDFTVNQELTDFLNRPSTLTLRSNPAGREAPFISWQHNWLAFVARDGMLKTDQAYHAFPPILTSFDKSQKFRTIIIFNFRVSLQQN